MSSEVQPKCTSSSAAVLGTGGSERIAHEVLHRLDVVIDARLDELDRLRRIGRRSCGERSRAREHGFADRLGRQMQSKVR